MRFSLMIGLLLFAVVLAPCAARGQAPGYYGYSGYYPGGYDAWGTRPATAAESYALGVADMLRAQGQFEWADSIAALNYANARRLEMENRYRYTQMYFGLRRMNRLYRERLRGPRATQADLIRYAQAAAPDRMTTRQFDRRTGDLEWPTVLQAESYATQRRLIEQALAVQYGAAPSAETMDLWLVRQSIEQMKQRLKEEIRELPTDHYLEARGFLDSLDYECLLL